RLRGHGVDRLLDDSHDLVPFPLNVGEHRIGLARQTGVADHLDGARHGLADAAGLVSAGGADADGNDHASILTERGGAASPPCSTSEARRKRSPPSESATPTQLVA